MLFIKIGKTKTLCYSAVYEGLDEMERLNQQTYDPFICIRMVVENARGVILACL